MPFVKLDCGILNSTLWLEREAREVFITALLMAEPIETTEPLPQIAIGSLDLTGWSVPPGWYGFVPAASVGILHRAKVPTKEGMEALIILGNPEDSSRSPEFEGRRLVRVSGGFIVLNFVKYREKDATTADRSRRWRERQKQKVSQRVSDTSSRVIRHQAEVQAEEEVTTEVRTLDRSTSCTGTDSLLSSDVYEHTSQNHNSRNGSGQGVGALPAGTIPRDHYKHSICGPTYRICIPLTLYAKFSRRYGPDDEVARPAIIQFVNELEATLGEQSVGDFLWLTKHFDAWLERTGRVPEAPTKKKTKPPLDLAQIEKEIAQETAAKKSRALRPR